ncbi:reverse transcriptase domain-containing protein [Paenibacillus sp. FSL H7-689]|uniref:reverse transcriptase domain-containing protein n=2 Tax=unclassified Paenibacillus TaxID=185978 RepID=UPI0003E2597D|nr:reverse transcriptase domain-containing protein [Paenibacillus sp. FSL H7-689]ETT54368.1 hypothetical protein C170_04558 [Paenibacillus sp. FSL H7-689]
MTIINEKYLALSPRKEYLVDPVILAQAWKKSHSYIRRHNWYADVLELDLSTITLEKNLNLWAEQLKTDVYKPDNLMLVPAPKTSTWEFPKEGNVYWKPTDKTSDIDTEEDFSLRPLAHIGIRDQSIATAAMLCLADAIETLQGPTDGDNFVEAQEQSVFSYGNRLHCHWDSMDGKNKATFGWGNSKSYRMYYEDYQQFLKRPKFMCQYYNSIAQPSMKQYVITLDLKKFYDRIDRTALINETKRLYEDYVSKYQITDLSLKDDNSFWKSLKNIFSWKWDPDDKMKSMEIFEIEDLPEGLPQGLVAGGFFSNIYMMRFDKKVGELLHKEIKTENLSNKIRIRDYCRYVDDMRLVIEASDDILPQELISVITKEVGLCLHTHLSSMKVTKHSDPLCINEDKTKIQSYQEISSQNELSARMNMLQNVISGTPDIDSIRQIISDLDSLLQLSEHLDEKQKNNFNSLALSRISVLNVDVNSDTLKRFAAKRLVDALRTQKGINIPEEDFVNTSQQTSGNVASIDHDLELYSRKLISIWSRNPALSSLLKFGLDLYPDPSLLSLVIDALESKIFILPFSFLININEKKHKFAMEYVAADLLCSSAVWIGYRHKQDYPQNIDVQAFRETLALFARKILKNATQCSWYLNQQAALYLASLDQPYAFKNWESLKAMDHYVVLHQSLLYETIEPVDIQKIEDRLVTSLVVQQLKPNVTRFALWMSEFYNLLSVDLKITTLKLLSINRPDLVREVFKHIKIEKEVLYEAPELSSIAYRDNIKKVLSQKSTNKTSYNLATIISSPDNPFQQENALLILIEKLLDPSFYNRLNSKSGLSLEDVQIKFKQFDSIQNPSIKDSFTLTLSSSSNSTLSLDRLYDKPWVKEEYFWLYNLGSIIRSCITGEYDFTTHSYLIRQDHSISYGYKGLKSTWFTRRFGMSVFAQGVFTEPLPLSPWLSELLLRMLQWPGIHYFDRHLKNFSEAPTRVELMKIIKGRKKTQQQLYGKLSNTPVYVLPVINKKREEDNQFRAVIVQSLLPNMSDFNLKNPIYWTPEFRRKHRGHIADVCHLVNKHLAAWQAASSNSVVNKREAANAVDLIVFPELSVHADDIDYLKRLSRQTKASIFAGVCFQERTTDKVLVNQAIWILYSDDDPDVTVWQGKKNMTVYEESMEIQGHRPYQLLVEFQKSGNRRIRVAGAICYDSTDLEQAADLRDISDMYVISALNQDVDTFDNMITALNYHMYQPVILANTGEFGGSAAYAPFKGHDKLIAHVHGGNQLAISMFDIDPTMFKNKSKVKATSGKKVKTSPAGFEGR